MGAEYIGYLMSLGSGTALRSPPASPSTSDCTAAQTRFATYTKAPAPGGPISAVAEDAGVLAASIWSSTHQRFYAAHDDPLRPSSGQRRGDHKQLHNALSRQRAGLKARWNLFAKNGSLNALRRLRRDGLEVGFYGVDWTQVQAARHSTEPGRLLTDPDVVEVMPLLMGTANNVYSAFEKTSSSRRHGPKATSSSSPALDPEDRIMWECDQPLKRSTSCVEPRAGRKLPLARHEHTTGPQAGATASSSAVHGTVLKRLQAHGFVRIPDWGALGLDLPSLTSQAERVLRAVDATNPTGFAKDYVRHEQRLTHNACAHSRPVCMHWMRAYCTRTS